MKAFRFRLETLLGLRRFEDERAQLARGSAERVLHGAEDEHAARSAGAREAAEAAHARLADGLPAGLARSAAAGLARLGAGVVEAGVQMEQARSALGQRRREAQEARTRLRTLEKLRERAAAAHRREAQARAQRELDEIASLRGGRSR